MHSAAMGTKKNTGLLSSLPSSQLLGRGALVKGLKRGTRSLLLLRMMKWGGGFFSTFSCLFPDNSALFF